MVQKSHVRNFQQEASFSDLLDRILDKGLVISEADRIKLITNPSDGPLVVTPQVEVECWFWLSLVDEPWDKNDVA